MQYFTKIGDSLLVRTTDLVCISRREAEIDFFIKNEARSKPFTITYKNEKEAIEIMDELLRI